MTLPDHESTDVRRLLEEIRDLQREQLAEYTRVTRRSIELQESALERQTRIFRIYKTIAAVASVAIVAVLILMIYLLASL